MNSTDNDKKNQVEVLDDLIKIAKLKPRVAFKKDKSDLDEVRQFITDLNIKPHSTAHVPASVIYSRYFQWSSVNNNKPRTAVFFFTRFKLHFNQKIVAGRTHYLIHPEGFDLSLESITLANVEYLKKRQKKTNKNK